MVAFIATGGPLVVQDAPCADLDGSGVPTQIRTLIARNHTLIACSGAERRLCGDLTRFHNKQAARVGSLHCYI
jgi:hypothetical protein